MKFKIDQIVLIPRNMYDLKSLIEESDAEFHIKNKTPLVITEVHDDKQFQCFGKKDCNSTTYYVCKTKNLNPENPKYFSQIQFCECELNDFLSKKVNKLLKY